jgi:hypothetical protein
MEYEFGNFRGRESLLGRGEVASWLYQDSSTLWSQVPYDCLTRYVSKPGQL